jgi:diguanylate cyclase (GGDEF)-like protein
MVQLLKSRVCQIGILGASFLLVICTATSLFLGALNQLHKSSSYRSALVQEASLGKLAVALSREREQMYRLYSSDVVSEDAIQHFKQLTRESGQLLERHILAKEASMSHGSNHGHSEQTNEESVHTEEHAFVEPVLVDQLHGGRKVEHGTTVLPVSGSHANESTTDSSEHKLHYFVASRAAVISLDELAARAAMPDENLIAQLRLPTDQRNPHLGMEVFHNYGSEIEFVGSMRRTLDTAPKRNLNDYYMYSKLKDVVWDLRESVSQVSTLLKGIVELSGASAEQASTQHHADMLIELNVIVDVAWQELYKVTSLSENENLNSIVTKTAQWYPENFKGLSNRLAYSSHYDSVSNTELLQWLAATDSMLENIESIHAESVSMTSEAVEQHARETLQEIVFIGLMGIGCIATVVASFRYFKRIDEHAHKDELTGLDNRRMFLQNLKDMLSVASQSGGSFSVLMIDLDRFKYINDTMGHAVGDQVLKVVAQRLQETATENQSLARLGGDEYALVVRGSNKQCILEYSAKISHSLKQEIQLGGATLCIGSSIGIASYPKDADQFDALIKAADLAMYCAKKLGTNKIVEYAAQLEQSLVNTASVISDLQVALERRQFELYYQPQFNLSLGGVYSVEALIRWNHPERGFVSPDDFIPIAEEHGLLPSIGDWVIDEACRQAAYWANECNMPLKVAVNVSADHLFKSGFVQSVLDCLKTNRLAPKYLELEVTESVAVGDMEQVVRSLRELRDSAITVALDDFGTGYSSLSYLQDLPLDTLKIDKSFIQKNLLNSDRTDSVTNAIVALGKSLHLETVAEGVETEAQLAAVSGMSISLVQGYYYSKPVSASEVVDVVRAINEKHNLAKAA